MVDAKSEQDLQKDLDAVTQSLVQSYEEIALLHRVSERMRVTQKPDEFFQRISCDLRSVLDVEGFWVLLGPQENEHKDIYLAAADGDVPIDGALISTLWQRTMVQMHSPPGVLIDNNSDGREMQRWPEVIRTIVSVPIKRDDKVMGILAAINKIGRKEFDSVDTKMLASVASESSIYLENFHLYQELQDLLMGSLKALTSSIDAKDPYTCGHSERVAMISRWLAQGLGLEEQAVRDAYLGGLLHDVGKIGISEAILCKPGQLTEAEFDEIRKHPQIGAKILQDIKPLREVNRAVLTHHERLNGCGYPHHLHGDEIPLIGRIVGLADSFDAMISDRVYRRAKGVDETLEEIRRCCGTHYDPQLVDLMTFDEVEQLLEQLDDLEDGSLEPRQIYGYAGAN